MSDCRHVDNASVIERQRGCSDAVGPDLSICTYRVRMQRGTTKPVDRAGRGRGSCVRRAARPGHQARPIPRWPRNISSCARWSRLWVRHMSS